MVACLPFKAPFKLRKNVWKPGTLVIKSPPCKEIFLYVQGKQCAQVTISLSFPSILPSFPLHFSSSFFSPCLGIQIKRSMS